MTERRMKRSESPSRALSLLLEAQRRKLGATALAVATRDGRLLAGAGRSADRLARAAVEGRGRIATWELRAGGQDLVVASLGGKLNHEIGAGVRRILAS
jgi:hypothetical protein